MVVEHINITERKQVELALLESEARFRSVLDDSRDMIYRYNLLTRQFEYVVLPQRPLLAFRQMRGQCWTPRRCFP